MRRPRHVLKRGLLEIIVQLWQLIRVTKVRERGHWVDMDGWFDASVSLEMLLYDRVSLVSPEMRRMHM